MQIYNKLDLGHNTVGLVSGQRMVECLEIWRTYYYRN